MNWSIIKNQIELLQFYGSYKRVFVYGAGKRAGCFVDYLKDNGLVVSGIVVSEGHKKSDRFKNIPIYELSEMVFRQGDGIIVSIDDKYLDSIYAGVMEKISEIDVRIQELIINSSMWDEKYASQISREKGFFKDYCLLQDIGERKGTDKAGSGHNYCNKYEFFFDRGGWREKEFVFVEIGVFKCSSVNMWREYFKKAIIYGIDIDKKCEKYAESGVNIWIKDISDESTIQSIRELKPSVIVDDASHKWSHQINTLINLFDVLPHGGIYILEDINTSFLPLKTDLFYADQVVTAYKFLSAVSECVASNNRCRVAQDIELFPYFDDIERISRETEMISFIAESCIIIKR